MEQVDTIIIGAGAIGLAIAQEISAPHQTTFVLEQHNTFGTETSSRHSEVIHAGIYYPAGSLKATLCVEGKERLYAYCRQYGVPFKKPGKLIVATCPEEIPQLDQIWKNAEANGVTDLEVRTADQLKSLEPALKATQALFSPSTGIIDSHRLMQSFIAKAESQGAAIVYETPVTGIQPVSEGFVVTVGGKDPFQVQARSVINAAGLHAPAVARKIEGATEIPEHYFCKGCYFTMSQPSPFSHLIYPVPEKNTTGLGIHVTLDMEGSLRFGPDTEYVDSLNYDVPMVAPESYYHAIRRYFPGLPDGALQPGYSGIRPKLQAPGAAAQDFMIQQDPQFPGLIQLFGIESPGMTSSLAIARYVKDLMKDAGKI